jgi:hypothetical protein
VPIECSTARARESPRGPANEVNIGHSTATKSARAKLADCLQGDVIALRRTRSSGALQMRIRVLEWQSSGAGGGEGVLDLGWGMSRVKANETMHALRYERFEGAGSSFYGLRDGGGVGVCHSGRIC